MNIYKQTYENTYNEHMVYGKSKNEYKKNSITNKYFFSVITLKKKMNIFMGFFFTCESNKRGDLSFRIYSMSDELWNFFYIHFLICHRPCVHYMCFHMFTYHMYLTKMRNKYAKFLSVLPNLPRYIIYWWE
jgi:L-rhamnose isomerase